MKKMYKITFALFFSILFLTQLSAQDTTKNGRKGHRLYINGSEAMFPAISQSGAEYKRLHQFSNNIDYKSQATGSALGIRNLIERHCDVATSTRKPTKQELLMAKDAGVELKEFIVAKEAWVIVANPECGVFRLNKDQVADIFSGKIRNWKEVGGDDVAIHVFIRSNSSGCYKGFKDMFFENGEDYSETALQLTSNGKLMEHVSKYKGGVAFIGYNAYTSLTGNVVAMQLSADNGENFIAPGQMTIDDGSYKFVRNCYLYINAKDYDILKPFLELATSEKSEKYWDDNGFNPIVMKSSKNK